MLLSETMANWRTAVCNVTDDGFDPGSVSAILRSSVWTLICDRPSIYSRHRTDTHVRWLKNNNVWVHIVHVKRAFWPLGGTQSCHFCEFRSNGIELASAFRNARWRWLPLRKTFPVKLPSFFGTSLRVLKQYAVSNRKRHIYSNVSQILRASLKWLLPNLSSKSFACDCYYQLASVALIGMLATGLCLHENRANSMIKIWVTVKLFGFT